MIPAELRNALPAEHALSFPLDDAVIATAFDADSKMTCELKPNQENGLAFEVEFLKCVF